MNKGKLKKFCLIQEITLLILRRISLTAICLILLNFNFKYNEETLSIISQCWIFLMFIFEQIGEALSIPLLVYRL